MNTLNDKLESEKNELIKEVEFLKRTNKGLRHSLEELSLLQHLVKGISSATETHDIIEQFISIIKTYWKYEGYVYYNLCDEDLSFHPTQIENITDEQICKMFDINQSILTWVLSEKQISSLPSNSATAIETSLFLIPFYTSTKLLGVIAIQVHINADDLLTVQTLEILNLAAGYASTTIEKSSLNENLYEQNKKLEEMRSFTNNIIESLVAGIVTFNMKNLITHINHNAIVMFGISDVEPIGKNYKEILSPSFAEIIHVLFNQTVKDGFVIDYQIDFELPGGVTIPYGISTSSLRNEIGDIVGMTLIARDMTASRELERLRSLDKLKNDFVGTVSHELRSPLATIRAYIDTLINRVDADDVENRNMFLSTIEKEAERLSTLVNNMLDIASIESGKIYLEIAHIEIYDIIEEVAKLCQMQTKKHEIKLDMKENLPKLNLDRDRVTQILHNLVNNAIKYSPKGGDIIIHAYEHAASVHIGIEDHGLGLKEEDQKFVFEKFYRVDSLQTSDIGGTGLGLSIVKKLVELHGGKIDLKSEYGVGSTFTLILPVP